MTPDELRALADALSSGTHYVESPELHEAMMRAADYLRAQADAQPVSEPTEAQIERLHNALVIAEAALADIGDADREPGDDLAWCEQRAAEALPTIRAALAAKDAK